MSGLEPESYDMRNVSC